MEIDSCGLKAPAFSGARGGEGHRGAPAHPRASAREPHLRGPRRAGARPGVPARCRAAAHRGPARPRSAAGARRAAAPPLLPTAHLLPTGIGAKKGSLGICGLGLSDLIYIGLNLHFKDVFWRM